LRHAGIQTQSLSLSQ